MFAFSAVGVGDMLGLLSGPNASVSVQGCLVTMMEGLQSSYTGKPLPLFVSLQLLRGKPTIVVRLETGKVPRLAR